MSQFLYELVTGRPVGVEAIADDDLATRLVFRRFEEPSSVTGRSPRTDGTSTGLGEKVPASAFSRAEGPQNRSSTLLAAVVGGSADRISRRDWTAVEQALGTPLPQDYKTILDGVGAGVLCDIALSGMDGSDAAGILDLLARQRDRLAAYPETQRTLLHPNRYGFLPWGETPDGWVFAWRIVFVDPNQWATVAIDPQMSCVELPGISFSQFLLRYAGADNNTEPLIQGRPHYQGNVIFQPRQPIGLRPGVASQTRGSLRLTLIGIQQTGSERWAYVSGHLEGDKIQVGDEVILAVDGVDTTTVRSVEKYSPPPITTIAVDAAAVADLL